MLISELLDNKVTSIISESDDFVLKSALNAIILDVRERLQNNSEYPVDIYGVIKALNARSAFLAIDPNDNDRRVIIMQEFEEHGMSVEQGSGKISLASEEEPQTDAQETEQEKQSQEVGKKAMDNIKKDSENGAAEL